MKKILFPIICSLLTISCATTNKNTPDYIANYINSISSDNLKKNLTVIASDEMEGRETGSEGQKKAGR